MSNAIIKETPNMLTGCDLIDLLVGGQKNVLGIPFGEVVSIVGDSSSGKTFLKNEIIAYNHHTLGDGFDWFSDDTEKGDTLNTSYLYGFDAQKRDKNGNRKIGTKTVTDSNTIEEMDAKVSMFLDTKDRATPDSVAAYFVDSLDGLSDVEKEEMEETRKNQLKLGMDVQDKGTMGMAASKFLSQQFFKNKVHHLLESKCSLVIVSQIRENVGAGMYGRKWRVACFGALKFYAHTQIFLRTLRTIEVNDKVVGAVVEAKTYKSKTPRPYRKAIYTVYFEYGIDNIGSNLDYLFDLLDKKYELKTDAQFIKWDGGAELTATSLSEWMATNGYIDEIKAYRKENGLSGAVSMASSIEWLQQDPVRKKAYEDYFGRTYTRDQLIEMCENDPEMYAELTRRVREKWEAIEDAARFTVLGNRPPKYTAFKTRQDSLAQAEKTKPKKKAPKPKISSESIKEVAAVIGGSTTDETQDTDTSDYVVNNPLGE